MTLDLAAIRAAREAIAGVARETPVWPCPVLADQLGVPVLLKCEQLQRTGSFKIRGAANFVARLSPDEAARGLVAASAGNHAQGVAHAAALRGIRATVVMPATAPLAKVNAAAGYGATVVLHGTSLEEARAHARALADRDGMVFVHPFDDDAVIAGQGTLGLELVEQVPDMAELIVPAGGGGLLAGVACAVKSLRPDVRIAGAQARAMDGLARSFRQHQRTTVPAARTIADGAAVAGPSDRTLALIEAHVEDVVAVSDEAIASAIVLLLERSKMVVEGAGALGVAALQSGAWRPRGPIVVVLSGGNIDMNLIGSIVVRGLVDAGRYQRLTVEVADVPGELALVARAIADAGGNILEVEHQREVPHLPVGVAVLELLLEVNGPAHFDAVVLALDGAGVRALARDRTRLATTDALRRHED